jgi:hypothetical protein
VTLQLWQIQVHRQAQWVSKNELEGQLKSMRAEIIVDEIQRRLGDMNVDPISKHEMNWKDNSEL